MHGRVLFDVANRQRGYSPCVFTQFPAILFPISFTYREALTSFKTDTSCLSERSAPSTLSFWTVPARRTGSSLSSPTFCTRGSSPRYDTALGSVAPLPSDPVSTSWILPLFCFFPSSPVSPHSRRRSIRARRRCSRSAETGRLIRGAALRAPFLGALLLCLHSRGPLGACLLHRLLCTPRCELSLGSVTFYPHPRVLAVLVRSACYRPTLRNYLQGLISPESREWPCRLGLDLLCL